MKLLHMSRKKSQPTGEKSSVLYHYFGSAVPSHSVKCGSNFSNDDDSNFLKPIHMAHNHETIYDTCVEQYTHLFV